MVQALTAKEIRQKFLAYFEKYNHTRVHSGSLVPKDDPSLLFANAGMVQFKKIFLGQEKRSYTRATTSQKCLRVSGKHNDLENVGRTARHHTFFEMLGNFSFGDYFKREAIDFAWRFVTQELGLPKDKLYVTVFREDDDAAILWQEVAGLAPERIFRMGEKDNFWAMGDTGPCGPCSEIYVDQGEDMACGPNCGIGSCDCDRFLEIWNLVFMQYDQPGDGTRVPLPRPSIDTGMGLERVAAVCQGKRSNFDCDLFQEIIQYIAQLAGVTYSFSAPDTNDIDTALRVIADHSRSAAFLIADGIVPSNEGRGYVLRRLLRRALRFAKLMNQAGKGPQEAFLYKCAVKVTEVMGDVYPELIESAPFISRVVLEEEERFRLTLDNGLALLEEEFTRLAASGTQSVPGDIAFKLYDTYGFPLDIVNDVAVKRGFSVDEEGFKTCMAEQKARARAAWKGSGEKDLANRFQGLLEQGIISQFVGYDTLKAESRIIALLDENALPVDALSASGTEKGTKGYVITGRTPFYGASGGQLGDSGMIEGPMGSAEVRDTLRPMPALIVHEVALTEGELLLDQEVRLLVKDGDRVATARNHTCTHLLHAALRRRLGSHVHQAGSLVGPDRLRFDFSHIAALSPEEIADIEADVNRHILADLPVQTEEMAQEAAVAKGAMALFGEKYGDTVRVVCVLSGEVQDPEEPVSMELCGGTHLTRTGQAGPFVILSEAGIAAGVRRIEALTGQNTLTYMAEQCKELNAIATALKARPAELATRVDALQKEVKSLKKDLEKAHGQKGQSQDIMAGLTQVAGIPFLNVDMGSMSIKALRETMDNVRSKLTSGVAVLAAEDAGKAQLLAYVSKDLHGKFNAPALIAHIAPFVEGAGGGRPDQAQAGGTKPEGITEALSEAKSFVESA